MSGVTVTVICPECVDGTAPNGYGCTHCDAQGHRSINRLPDGAVPPFWPDGTPVVEWCPPMLPARIPLRED